MKKLPSKKYTHNYFQTIQKEQKNNTKKTSESEENIPFIFSSIPLSESLNISQIYSLLLQDTLWRFKKSKKKPYKKIIHYAFSQNIYKGIGNQTVQTHKIRKQIQQNINKIDSFCQEEYQEKENIFCEKNLYTTRMLCEKLYENNHISYKQKICHRDTKYGIQITEEEKETKEINTELYQIKYFIDGKGISININTHDPYFIFSAVAIAVNPKDRRYAKYLKKEILIPIINKKIPIITDERVSMIEGEGAMLINPGHDKLSLDIAKEHNLKTTLTSIDNKGFMTEVCGEFAGKNIEEHKENIIKFLKDIGNLNPIKKEKKKYYFNKYSTKQLYPIATYNYILTEEKNIKECKENTSLEENFDKIVIENDKKNIIKKESHQDIYTNSIIGEKHTIVYKDNITISNYFKIGSLLPFLVQETEGSTNGQHILFSEKKILEQNPIIQNIKDDKALVLGLIIINLIREGKLKTTFSPQKCIQKCFEKSYTKSKLKYEAYCDIYHNHENEKIKKGEKEIKIIFDNCNKNSNYNEIIKILEYIPFFQKQKNNSYQTRWDLLINNKKENKLQKVQDIKIQNSCYIDQALLNSTLLQEEIIKKDGIYCYQNTEYKAIQTIFLLHCINYISIPNNFSEYLRFCPPLYNKTQTEYNYTNSKIEYAKLQDLQKKNGPDIIRYLGIKNQFNYDNHDISYIKRMEQKIRNIARLVAQKDTYSRKDSQYIEKNINKFNEFDLWILKKTSDYIKEIKRSKQQDNIKTLTLIEEYLLGSLDLYIEIQKHISSTLSNEVLRYCFIFFLQNLTYYMPLLCKSISDFFSYENISISEIQTPTIEYKCNIFSEIIKTIHEMKLEIGSMKHEKINLIICSRVDIKNFLEDIIGLITSLLQIKEIEIQDYDYTIDNTYTTKQIIDTKIAIKKAQEKISPKEHLVIIQKEISYLEDEIQRKKIFLGRIINIGNHKKIQEKKKEIENIKRKIEELKIALL